MQDSEFRPAIEALLVKLQEHEKTVTRTKELINELCAVAGLAPMYTIETAGTPDLAALRADAFYGRPLATAVREYLEMRKAANQGPATVNEIHRALVQGGYVFETKDDDNAKRGLREALSKNVIFHRLPGGQYGLRSWYPAVREPKAPTKKAKRGRRRAVQQRTEGPPSREHSERPRKSSAPPSRSEPVTMIEAAVAVLEQAQEPLHRDEIVSRLEKLGRKVNRDSLESMLSKAARTGERGLHRGGQPQTFALKVRNAAMPATTANGASE